MDIRDVRKPRRIVTGTGEDGRSYLARVEEVDTVEYAYVLPAPATPAGEAPQPHHADDARSGDAGFYRIWGSDRLPIPLPTDGRAPYFDSDPTPDETPEALRYASILPPPLGVRIGWSRHRNPSPAGAFHWTDSTDILFVMAGMRGEILEEGQAVLRAGDVLVQNGTMHSHEDLGDEATILGYVVVGALRTGPHPPVERLHRVSDPLGGHRRGEYRDKRTLAPWWAPTAPPGTYEGCDRTPLRASEVDRPRRFVTGTNAAGRSYYARIEEARRIDGKGSQVWPMWRIDKLPDLFPGGDRRGPTEDELVAAPRAPEPLGVSAALLKLMPSDEPGPMHGQDTMDTFFVMAGGVTLRLENGDEIDLRPGDVLIQNGTLHSWHVRGKEPVVMGFASFAGVRL